MKHLLPTLLATLLCGSLFGQSFKSHFSFTGGNVGADEIRDITTDAQGNIYITGSFTDSVDFDPGAGTFYLTTPAGNKPDAFIQKLDANGNFLWAKSFRGTYNDEESGHKIALDDTGNVYLLGRFQRNIFFTYSGYQWPGNATGASITRPFLTKLDSAGNVKWGMGWMHSNQNDYLVATDLKLHQNGSVLVSGYFSGNLDFDPTTDSVIVKSTVGGFDCFLLNISNQGKVGRTEVFGGVQNNDIIRQISVDQIGNVFLLGKFIGTVDFNFGQGTSTFTSNGFFDIFITKLKPNLDYDTTFTFGGPTLDDPFSLFASNGFIYSVGTFTNTVDFDPDPINTTNLTSSIGNDLFVQKLDTAGNFSWVKQFSGIITGYAQPININETHDSKIFISGMLMGTIDFDPDPAFSYNLTSYGKQDAFIAMLDSSGNFVAASQFGDTDDDIFWSAHVTQNNEVLVGGSFQNTIDIDPSANTNLVTSIGQKDMFFVNLELCTTQEDTMPVLVCNYFVIPGDTVQNTTSGFYTGNYFDVSGCDSTVVFDVFVRNFAVSIVQTIDGLAASNNASNPTYQWLDCSTQQIVPGATSQIFMPPANGQYAVIVSDINCTDTSACFAINNIKVNVNLLAQSIKLFPNPTTGLLQLESPKPIEKVEVFDVTGRLMFSRNNPKEKIDLTALPKGIYMVKLHLKEGVVVKRAVKE